MRPRPPRPQRQFSTLVRRQLRIILSDRSYAALTLLMPIVLGLAAGVIPGDHGFSPAGEPTNEPGQLLLVLVMCGALMGMVSTVRELIAERAIHLRERAVGVQPDIYLASKATVLTGLSLLQAILLVTVVRFIKDGPDEGALFPGGTSELVIMVFLMTLATGMLGLFFSALVTSQEQTMPVLAVSVILQLLLCGGLVDITGTQPIDFFSHFVPGRWAFGMGANTVDLRALNPRFPDDWMWEHDGALWLLSGFALVTYAIVMFYLTLRLLGRQRSL